MSTRTVVPAECAKDDAGAPLCTGCAVQQGERHVEGCRMLDKRPPTPTLDEISEIKGESQPVGEFLAWLFQESPYMVGEYVEVNSFGDEDLRPARLTIPELLGEYFGIDPRAASLEREAVYEYARNRAGERGKRPAT